jgi:hypothetical protein
MHQLVFTPVALEGSHHCLPLTFQPLNTKMQLIALGRGDFTVEMGKVIPRFSHPIQQGPYCWCLQLEHR